MLNNNMVSVKHFRNKFIAVLKYMGMELYMYIRNNAFLKQGRFLFSILNLNSAILVFSFYKFQLHNLRCNYFCAL